VHLQAYSFQSLRLNIGDNKDENEHLRKDVFSNSKDLKTIACCAVKSSYDLNARLIIVFTYSGVSAKIMAHNRPKCPIFAVTPNEFASKCLLLFGGMHTMIVGSLIGREALQHKVIGEARKRGLLK